MNLTHLTPVSSNKKTGPIPVSTSSRDTCGACPFKRNGCYADSGPLALHWDAVTRGDRGMPWLEFCDAIAALPDDQLWRMNQAGDLPLSNDGVTIDAAELEQLVDANHGKRGFTYTHHALTEENLQEITLANVGGFTINLSANDLAHADTLIDTGLPTVVVLPAEQTTNTVTPRGRKVIVCPATYRDNVTCASCGMCAIANRGDTCVGFPAHGTSHRKASEVARRTIAIKAV